MLQLNLAKIREKLLNSTPISREEAKELYLGASLLELGELANAIRFKLNPERQVTYLIDRNINYTNVCNTDCQFCAFYRHDPKHPESYVTSRELMKRKLDELIEIGGTRVLLQGGHNDELPYSYYVDMISWIRQNYKIEINAFSPSEIQQMKKISGKAYLEILTELKAAGMNGLPGGGAELLDDDVRKRVSPKKISADEWIEVMEVAQNLDLTTTATMVIGFGETLDQRLNHLERLRNLQTRSNAKGLRGFNLFISWSLQANQNTSLGRSRHAATYGATSVEYMKNLAFARVFLHNIPHHQASWPTFGPEIAQLGLHFGCDDVGSTMMEENVVSQAGAPTKTKWAMSPAELREYITEAGFTPAKRNSAFDILEVHHSDYSKAAAVTESSSAICANA